MDGLIKKNRLRLSFLLSCAFVHTLDAVFLLKVSEDTGELFMSEVWKKERGVNAISDWQGEADNLCL